MSYDFHLTLYFLGSLFIEAPQTKVLFGFPIDIDVSKDLVKSKRFTMHASYMVQMLDTALNLLGPDAELLTEILSELGVKHVRYGVKPAMFQTMGDSIIFTLEKVLGDDFDKATREAWVETYEAIKQDMIKAQLKKK